MTSLWSRSLNGLHSIVYRNGDSYSGEFRNSKAHGRGTFNYNLTDTEFADSCQNSQFRSRLIRAQSNYTGQFSNSSISGYGRLIFPNGDVYSGDFVNNIISGRGSFRSASTNSEYIGDWSNGQFNGFGLLYYANGDVYEGNWICGKQSGRGEMTYHNGDIFRGTLIDGQQTGVDCEFYSAIDDETYVGEMNNGLRHGIGQVTRNVSSALWQRSSYKGVWKQGQLVRKFDD